MRCGITFKKTNKLWVWRAYDPFQRRTVAWVTGGRDDATCKRLLDKINIMGKIIIADHWKGFQRLIPSNQLLIGKQYTHSIERDNSNIRHFLARFRRRTKVVSQKAYMVVLSLRLYHHLHDDKDNLEAYIRSFHVSLVRALTEVS